MNCLLNHSYSATAPTAEVKGFREAMTFTSEELSCIYTAFFINPPVIRERAVLEAWTVRSQCIAMPQTPISHSSENIRTGCACANTGQHLSGANFPIQVHGEHTK